MVHGEVRAPMLDLANRDLVESHLHAIWLAETGVKLAPSIAEILELGESGRPVRPTLMGDMRAAGVEKKAHPRMTAVLGALADEFDSENAPWFAGAASFAEEVTESAARRFERAFDRWRDLLIAAERQRDLARRDARRPHRPTRPERHAQCDHRREAVGAQLRRKPRHRAPQSCPAITARSMPSASSRPTMSPSKCSSV